MNVSGILTSLDALGLDVPASVARARTAVRLLSEADIPPIQLLTPAQLAHTVLAQTAAEGAVPDVIALARAARQRTDSVLAHLAVEQAVELAERRLEQAIKAATAQIITGSVRPMFDASMEEARALPATVPVNAESAVSAGDGESGQAYRHLVQLAGRMTRLSRLHVELIRDDLITDQALVFADTKAAARVDKTVERAGPSQPTSRLLWLASPGGQA